MQHRLFDFLRHVLLGAFARIATPQAALVGGLLVCDVQVHGVRAWAVERVCVAGLIVVAVEPVLVRGVLLLPPPPVVRGVSGEPENATRNQAHDSQQAEDNIRHESVHFRV